MTFRNFEIKVENLNFIRSHDFYINTSIKSAVLEKLGLSSSQQTHSIKTEYVLKNISFTVQPKDRLAILGGNGSGKTTLAKVLAGRLQPSSGTIASPNPIRLFHHFENMFLDELTGFESVLYFGQILYPKHTTTSLLEFCESFSELGDSYYRRIETFSSGMKSRLALALMCFDLTDYTIFDEVTGFVDASFKQKFLSRLKERDFQNSGYIYISHHRDEIKSVCHRAIYLENGEIVYDGSIEKAIAVVQFKGTDVNESRI